MPCQTSFVSIHDNACRPICNIWSHSDLHIISASLGKSYRALKLTAEKLNAEMLNEPLHMTLLSVSIDSCISVWLFMGVGRSNMRQRGTRICFVFCFVGQALRSPVVIVVDVVVFVIVVVAASLSYMQRPELLVPGGGPLPTWVWGRGQGLVLAWQLQAAQHQVGTKNASKVMQYMLNAIVWKAARNSEIAKKCFGMTVHKQQQTSSNKHNHCVHMLDRGGNVTLLSMVAASM